MSRRGCSYCGLPVQAGKDDGPLYCCVGCRIASAVGGQEDGKRGFLEARLLISAFLAMGIMTFSLVLYSESVYGIESDPEMDVVRRIGRYFLAVLAVPVLLLLGVPLLKGAWKDLLAGRIRMDGLIVIAVLAAFTLSFVHTASGTGEVYYETATMVLVLVTFGRRLEAHARSQGKDAAKILLSELPAHAERVTDCGTVETVDRQPFQSRDRLQIRPGELLPADVIVTSGESTVDLAHLTGEHVPEPVGPGREVPAGAVNGDGLLLVQVLRTAEDGSLGRIRALLDAPLPSTRSLRVVDRLAGVLATASIVLAVAAGIRETRAGRPGEALKTSLAILLVACPCALGLATPLAFRAMRAALARRGVLVHDPVAMEVAPNITGVLLDKTGTLTDPTRGELEVLQGSESAVARTRAMLRASGHMLGRLVRGPVGGVTELRAIPGLGVTGVVDGVSGSAGRPEWVFAGGLTMPQSMAQHVSESDASLVAGRSDDGQNRLLRLRQTLRDGVAESIDQLRRRGMFVEILSGDRPRAVQAVAETLGIAARSALLPEDKVARINELQGEGHLVMMAGDGVNDGPALRASDLSIAMGEGTALARSEAQVELMSRHLFGLPLFFEGARLLRSTIRGNLFWTVAYNGVAVALAYMGKLHPLAAVSAMILSSIIISVRSVRLLHFGELPPSGAVGAMPHSISAPLPSAAARICPE